MDKKLKATTNPINKKDNKSFQYAIKVMLNHEKIEKTPKRITEIKCFIDKNNWEGTNFPMVKDDWKRFKKNNLTIALSVLHAKKAKNISCICFKAYLKF